MLVAEAPGGRHWTVQRVWLPWTPKQRRVHIDRGDFIGRGLDFDLGVGDSIAAFVVVLAAVVVLAFLLGPFVGLALFGFEWLLLFLVLPLVAAARLVLRLPFPVVAECEDERYVTQVVGLAAWAAAVRRIADEIRVSGHPVTIQRASV